ncbi:MAG: hypothetical protein ACQET1_03265 [Gemmatimonadota bacterium]
MKLGVDHTSSTIRRYMAPRKREGGPASTTWRTFLAGHANELWTMDLTTQPLWDYSMRYVLVIMEPRSRRGVILYDGDQVLPFGEGLFAAPISTLWDQT